MQKKLLGIVGLVLLVVLASSLMSNNSVKSTDLSAQVAASTATTTTIVNCANYANPTKPIVGLTPICGEILTIGQTYTVQWKSSTSSIPKIDIKLKSTTKPTFYVIASNYPNKNSYDYTVGKTSGVSTVVPGEYYFLYCKSGTTACQVGGGSKPFIIKATASTTQVQAVLAYASTTNVSLTSTSTATVALTYRLQANNGPVYVSTAPAIATLASTTAARLSLTSIIATPTTISGDTASSFVIPEGQTRTFTINGLIDNTGGTSGSKSFWVSKLYWSSIPSNIQASNITSGLEKTRTMLYLTGGGSVPTPQPASITVIAPNGGEVWAQGSQRTISWTSSGIPADAKIKISLVQFGGGYQTVATDVPAGNNSYAWTVNRGSAVGPFKIELFASWTEPASPRSAYDLSNATFTIQ